MFLICPLGIFTDWIHIFSRIQCLRELMDTFVPLGHAASVLGSKPLHTNSSPAAPPLLSVSIWSSVQCFTLAHPLLPCGAIIFAFFFYSLLRCCPSPVVNSEVIHLFHKNISVPLPFPLLILPASLLADSDTNITQTKEIVQLMTEKLASFHLLSSCYRTLQGNKNRLIILNYIEPLLINVWYI